MQVTLLTGLCPAEGLSWMLPVGAQELQGIWDSPGLSSDGMGAPGIICAHLRAMPGNHPCLGWDRDLTSQDFIADEFLVWSLIYFCFPNPDGFQCCVIKGPCY